MSLVFCSSYVIKMAERDDEAYQIKEILSGQFKFPDSPQNNKLMYLKDVHKWILKITVETQTA